MTEKQKHEHNLKRLAIKPWIAVDLDRTLAEYHGDWGGPIGKPIDKMVERVYKWRAAGKLVKLFTARADEPPNIPKIKAWLETLGLEDLEITNQKDLGTTAIWDDIAVGVVPNTGEREDGKWMRDHQEEKK